MSNFLQTFWEIFQLACKFRLCRIPFKTMLGQNVMQRLVTGKKNVIDQFYNHVPVPLFSQLLQHLRKQNQFSRRLDQTLSIVIPMWSQRCFFCRCREQVRMVTALLQIHHDVQQRNRLATTFWVQRLEVTGQDVLVVFLLHGRQFNSHDELRFRRHVL